MSWNFPVVQFQSNNFAWVTVAIQLSDYNNEADCGGVNFASVLLISNVKHIVFALGFFY